MTFIIRAQHITAQIEHLCLIEHAYPQIVYHLLSDLSLFKVGIFVIQIVLAGVGKHTESRLHHIHRLHIKRLILYLLDGFGEVYHILLYIRHLERVFLAVFIKQNMSEIHRHLVG